MRRLLTAALLLLVGFAVPATAQTDSLPNYLIRSLSCGIESGQVVVRFDVINSGGPAQESALAATSLAADGGPLATQEVRPLGAGESQPVQLRFPSNLASGTLRLRSTVTLDAANSANGQPQVETASCTVTIPTIQPTTAAPISPAPVETGEIVLPGGIVLSTEAVTAVAVAVCCAGLLFLGLVLLIVRGMTRTGPVFPVWQPPYVPPAMLNPASQAGARAGWQDHAASDALPSPCLPMDHAARKVLLGMDGIKLRNWRIDALRASQYDMYGRVGRTQVIATSRLVKHLNRQMNKAQFQPGRTPRSPETIVKALRPSAAWIANRLIKRIERTPSLPIALDIRLTGDHGTVRILFELYTCADGQWQIVDAWEPEMMLRSGVIAENFSYTFYGRNPDETKRAFRRRLREEIAQRLGLMMAQPRPQPPPAADEPPPPAGSTAPSTPVLFDQPAPPPTQEIPRVPDAPGDKYEF